MNLIKRLRNLWRISEGKTVYEHFSGIDNLPTKERPRQAEIIHLKTQKDIIKELLNEEQ